MERLTNFKWLISKVESSKRRGCYVMVVCGLVLMLGGCLGFLLTRWRTPTDPSWALPLALGVLFTLMGYIRAVILAMRAQHERRPA